MVHSVHFFSTAVLILALAGAATSPEKDLNIHIDHVIVGMNNLDRAVIEFEKQTGVRPVLGGKNSRGRQNGLVSLGHGSYLELVEVGGPLDKLTPIAWGVSASDPEVIRGQLSKSGFEATDPEPGSRLTPSGTTLRWRTFGLKDNFPGAPFFIVWDPDSPHPSATSPSGCTLESLNVSSPNVKELVRLTEALNLHIETRSSTKRELTVLLSCPKGKVLLGSTTDYQQTRFSDTSWILEPFDHFAVVFSMMATPTAVNAIGGCDFASTSLRSGNRICRSIYFSQVETIDTTGRGRGYAV